MNPPRVSELIALGLMHLAGFPAFAGRDEAKFRANSKAWEFSAGQPSSYRRHVSWRVMEYSENAKRST